MGDGLGDVESPEQADDVHHVGGNAFAAGQNLPNVTAEGVGPRDGDVQQDVGRQSLPNVTLAGAWPATVTFGALPPH